MPGSISVMISFLWAPTNKPCDLDDIVLADDEKSCYSESRCHLRFPRGVLALPFSQRSSSLLHRMCSFKWMILEWNIDVFLKVLANFIFCFQVFVLLALFWFCLFLVFINIVFENHFPKLSILSVFLEL